MQVGFCGSLLVCALVGLGGQCGIVWAGELVQQPFGPDILYAHLRGMGSLLIRPSARWGRGRTALYLGAFREGTGEMDKGRGWVKGRA